MDVALDGTGPTSFLSSLLTSYGLLGALATGLAIYSASLATYRLFFHPLAGFPGPRLAAATGWYESYYDLVKGGKYIHKIEEMHKLYGPILRINPHEIVVNDPDFYNTVYVTANTRRTETWPLYQGVGIGSTFTSTPNHELHRLRRKPFESFFSRAGIDRTESIIIEEAKLMDNRLQSLKGSSHVIQLMHVFSAFTVDVIQYICSEKSPELMNRPEFGKTWIDMVETALKNSHLLISFPQLVHIGRMTPTKLLRHLSHAVATSADLYSHGINHIVEVKRAKLSDGEVRQSTKGSVFRHVLSGGMPESECDTHRLGEEAMVFLVASTNTVSRTLNVVCYYMLRYPHMRDRLGEELRDVMAGYPNNANLPTWRELERLPYLHAVYKEGLRLSCGVMRRIPRVSPDVPLHYKQWTIPAGTPVGMAAYTLHRDPETYPDPFSFIPERWLGEYNPNMDRNWVPYTRGSRDCLGINLATAELHWVLAVLFRPDAPRLELFQTEEEDIVGFDDYVAPLPRLDSKGTRVKVC
ncbi:hypothetical protein BDW74DRAFT_189894 [Aspergillus multicolor]|uniref:cytochrome P450 n=1 Tax=Aspergillus multicolor TaxID=41759 RepID=UPI003CCDEE5E